MLDKKKMKDIHKITLINNEKDYINKRLQLHRFTKIEEWIQKCFHEDMKRLKWAFKKSEMGILAYLDLPVGTEIWR